MTSLTIAFLCIIIFITLIFVFYRRVILLTHFLITLLFSISLIGATSAVFLQDAYYTITENIFEETFFAQQLKYADGTLESVASIPGDIVDSIEDLFGEDEEKTEVDIQLYSSFITFVGNIFRIFVFTISLIVMIFTTYFRYSFAGLREYSKLQKRVKALELKLAGQNDE
jgi:hypothetical protein